MTKKSHPLKTGINTVITVNTDKTPEEICEAVMEFLGETKVIEYAPKESLKLLTPTGRVLVALVERPDMTMRELSLYLGVTESSVMRCVLNLVRANVIARTKVRGRNRYRLNLEEAKRHPDIVRLYAVARKAVGDTPEQGDDIQPSDDPDAA